MTTSAVRDGSTGREGPVGPSRDQPIAHRNGALAVDLALEATVGLSFSRVGFEVRRRVWAWAEPPAGCLAGQVAVVTGATSGLGLALATRLAGLGTSVVAVGRDRARTDAARDEIAVATGGSTVLTAHCDLARLDDVRALANEIRNDHGRLDLLVHNAGALVHEFERTVDGLELTAQTHVVAPFLLTAELLDVLQATPGARVLTVASGGMYTTGLGDLDLGPDDYDGVQAYARAKRAQVVLNAEWARRHGTKVRFEAMHPGWVDTPGLRASLPGFARVMAPLLRTPEQGVDTLVWLATAPVGANGRFWLDRRRRWTSKLPWTATSPAEANGLWEWAVRRSGATP